MADDDTSAFLDVIGHAADILGVVLPAVSLAGDVVKWFAQAPAASDPIVASLTQVDAALGELQDEVLASWVTARQDNLAFLRANSTAALQTAYTFMQSGADASSPEWAANIALAQTNSLIAVQAFVSGIDTGYWRRPYSIKAISQDGDPTAEWNGWMTSIPDRAPKDGDNTVWDYRWALPATVYAITARLTVLRLIGWDPAAILREVAQYNNFIAQVCQRMYSGIKFLDPSSEPPAGPFGPIIALAVADIYGGYFIAGGFDTLLTPHDLGNRPYPPGWIGSNSRDWPTVVENAKTLTTWWRYRVEDATGYSKMLQFAGQLEIALQPPIPPPFHSGDGQPVPGGPFSYGVYYRASVDGILYWYKYEGNGESDPSGKTGWNANSGNPIGKGWNNFRFLLGAGDGVILGVEPNGDMRWYRYTGNGENNIEGNTGWYANSGNQIGQGWKGFNQLVVQPAAYGAPMVIYGVLPNGDLVWYSYAGQGESDPTGSKGWVANSGNLIGNGWQTMRLFCSGDVIFGISPDGELRWYSYQGDGTADESGATGWDPNSDNVIATNWGGYRYIIAGGHLHSGTIFAVDGWGVVHYFHYMGSGVADPTGQTGWAANYGNAISTGGW